METIGIADMSQVAAVSWLLSDEAGYIVGHVLCADGGFLAAIIHGFEVGPV